MSKIRSLVQRYEDEAQGLRDRNSVLTAEIESNVRKLSLIEATIKGIVEAQEALGAATSSRKSNPTRNPQRRRRGLGENWRKILRGVDPVGTFSYDNLDELAKLNGHEISRDNLRSQMSLYRASGLVKSAGPGMFRLTDEGKAAAGVDNEFNENEAPIGDAKGASETEEAATSSIENRPGFRLVG